MNSLGPGMDVQADSAPAETARRIVVFDADPSEVEAQSATLPPDVMIEPEIMHYPAGGAEFRLFGDAGPAAASPFPTGTGKTLKLRVTGKGSPLANATVHVSFRGPGGLSTSDSATTNSQGRVTFQHSSIWTPSTAVAAPAGDFWVMVAFAPTTNLTIDCPALPKDGPLGWWHKAVGIQTFKATLGKSIKVGVIDTGCGPHAALSHAKLVGAFINGNQLPAAATADVDSHGSHVCGTIGARPTASGQYAGIAPGADLFAARVFPGPDSGANQGDIAAAIDALSRDHKVDLINMSLGAKQGSQIELDAIQDALERGTLCVCAAGNSDGPVEFPGGFDECVAVAALGLLGWGPAGSLASLRVPTGQTARFGNDSMYHASFSCFGDGLDVCAPGVGILATVPKRGTLTAPFGVMDGTSMASPVACGALACRLSASTAYKALPRDSTRSAMARTILKASVKDVGMTAKFQGLGMPVVS
jgi:subtilisin